MPDHAIVVLDPVSWDDLERECKARCGAQFYPGRMPAVAGAARGAGAIGRGDWGCAVSDAEDDGGSGIRSRFEAVDGEYLKFERIPEAERLHPCPELCAYLKIWSLLKAGKGFDLHGEHDIVYLADIDDMVELTDADILYLTRCGIHYDSECSCLADFC